MSYWLFWKFPRRTVPIFPHSNFWRIGRPAVLPSQSWPAWWRPDSTSAPSTRWREEWSQRIVCPQLVECMCLSWWDWASVPPLRWSLGSSWERYCNLLPWLPSSYPRRCQFWLCPSSCSCMIYRSPLPYWYPLSLWGKSDRLLETSSSLSPSTRSQWWCVPFLTRETWIAR